MPGCKDGSAGHCGQVKWSTDERELFGVVFELDTDINILEFITAVLAIVVEKEYLRGCTIRIRVDNTAAVSWLNKLKSKHINGQLWVAVLVSTLLEYHITLICDHIAGIANIIADGLSRFDQECLFRLEQSGYTLMTMPDVDYRMAIWKESTIDFWQNATLIPQWHA